MGRTPNVKHVSPLPSYSADLVSWSILSQSDGVMGHDIDHTRLTECRHPHRTPHVICEDEEGGAVRNQPRVLGDTVADSSHGVLSHTETDVTLCWGFLLEVTELLHEGHVGGGQVSRPSNQTRENVAKGVQHGLGQVASGISSTLRRVGLPENRFSFKKDTTCFLLLSYASNHG